MVRIANPYPRRSDVVPGITDLELSMQHGRSLSNAVEMALTVNPRPIAGPIRAAYEEIMLSYANKKRADHPYPVQVIKIGNDLTFITLGSEVVVDYSLRFKKEFAGSAGLWVAGYSNDYTGYVPQSPRAQGRWLRSRRRMGRGCGGPHRQQGPRPSPATLEVAHRPHLTPTLPLPHTPTRPLPVLFLPPVRLVTSAAS